jgi:integrase
MAVAAISSRTIASYISSRAGKVSNSTIRRDLTALSRLLSACVSWGWITDNPARSFDRSIVRQKVATLVIPTDAELDTVLKACPIGMRPVLRLLDQTGMRENEAVTLAASDVDWVARQIKLSKTKTNRPRALNWTTPGGDAAPVLEPLSATVGPLFPSRSGEPYAGFATSYGQVLRRVAEREAKAETGFRRFRAHDLRHRFAIRWLKNGGDIFRLSRHLGHTSVRTTEMYVRHLTDDEMDKVRGVVRL